MKPTKRTPSLAPRVLITGGLGFIGFNATRRHSAAGRQVVILDNLSRPTAQRNFTELQALAGPRPILVSRDISNASAMTALFAKHGPFDLILHLAAQVAVTNSITAPRTDFEVNALGTLNLLEATRLGSPNALFIYASTNKVYGPIKGIAARRLRTRYASAISSRGVDEDAPLDFQSPYACSKGAADQYVLDFSRIYGLRTTVFRQSCTYGPWQYGDQDQGWVAHFMAAALTGKTITVCGDGRQVRDLLFIDDLLDLYDLVWAAPTKAIGRVFNIGGGPDNTLSLLELLAWLRSNLGHTPTVKRAPWRYADQRVYVSDISLARTLLGWRPKTPIPAGLAHVLQWLAPRILVPPAPTPDPGNAEPTRSVSRRNPHPNSRCATPAATK